MLTGLLSIMNEDKKFLHGHAEGQIIGTTLNQTEPFH